MRKAKVLFKNEEAGMLTQWDDGTFSFQYLHQWLINIEKPNISLTLPKSKKEFHSPYLFAFFYNLLPEGSNKYVVCQRKQIDPDDAFGILLYTAKYDCIGAVRVIKIENP